MNQYEIQQALLEFIQKRTNTSITLKGFGIKGLRGNKGYIADIEFVYADVPTDVMVPKINLPDKNELDLVDADTLAEDATDSFNDVLEELPRITAQDEIDLEDFIKINMDNNTSIDEKIEKLTSIYDKGSDLFKKYIDQRGYLTSLKEAKESLETQEDVKPSNSLFDPIEDIEQKKMNPTSSDESPSSVVKTIDIFSN